MQLEINYDFDIPNVANIKKAINNALSLLNTYNKTTLVNVTKKQNNQNTHFYAKTIKNSSQYSSEVKKLNYTTHVYAIQKEYTYNIKNTIQNINSAINLVLNQIALLPIAKIKTEKKFINVLATNMSQKITFLSGQLINNYVLQEDINFELFNNCDIKELINKSVIDAQVDNIDNTTRFARNIFEKNINTNVEGKVITENYNIDISDVNINQENYTEENNYYFTAFNKTNEKYSSFINATVKNNVIYLNGTYTDKKTILSVFPEETITLKKGINNIVYPYNTILGKPATISEFIKYIDLFVEKKEDCILYATKVDADSERTFVVSEEYVTPDDSDNNFELLQITKNGFYVPNPFLIYCKKDITLNVKEMK